MVLPGLVLHRSCPLPLLDDHLVVSLFPQLEVAELRCSIFVSDLKQKSRETPNLGRNGASLPMVQRLRSRMTVGGSHDRT